MEIFFIKTLDFLLLHAKKYASSHILAVQLLEQLLEKASC